MTPAEIAIEIEKDRIACLPITVAPAYGIGATVLFRGQTWEIARIYPGADWPQWYGGKLILYTHCYELRRYGQPYWGAVDAELTRANDDWEFAHAPEAEPEWACPVCGETDCDDDLADAFWESEQGTYNGAVPQACAHVWALDPNQRKARCAVCNATN